MSRNSKMNLYARKNSNPSRGNFPQTWEVIDGNGSGWFYIVTIPQGGNSSCVHQEQDRHCAVP